MTAEQQEASRLRDVALGMHAAGLTAITQRGVDPTIVRDEILTLIGDAIDNTPRSLQKAIGPSEIGTPCQRQLGFKLAATPHARTRQPAWRATVGTAVHAWLAAKLEAHNTLTGIPRWLVETRVNVGEIAAEDIYGSCDAYDILSAGVVDWKIVGPTSLRDKKTNGPGEQYRTQVHTYGRGITTLGLPVDWVAVFFLPANGELTDGYFWYEPYDENIATQALERASRIRNATVLVGAATVLPALPTADAPCAYCPWLNPAAAKTNPATACAGHQQRTPRIDPIYALAGRTPPQ